MARAARNPAAMRQAERLIAPVPRGLLSEGDAALWLGVSATTLRGLGIPRRSLGARRLYDVRDLEALRDALPYEGDSRSEEERACDAAFG